MNKTLFLPVIILFFLLYYFVFPVEGSLETLWTASAPAEPDSAGIQSEFPPFEGPGFPLILGNRYFAADYGTAYIREYSADGDVLWTWQGLAPLSALSWNDDYLAVGSIDGVIRIFDRNGSVRELQVPGNSVDHAVYGLSLSPFSRTVSFVAGYREQRLYIYSLEDLSELRSEALDSDYRRPVKMYSTGGETEMLWVEQPRGLLCYRDEEMPLFVPVEGSLLTMKRDEASSLVYILSTSGASGEKCFLKILSPEGDLLLSNSFAAFPDSFDLQDDTVIFTMDREKMVYGRQEL